MTSRPMILCVMGVLQSACAASLPYSSHPVLDVIAQDFRSARALLEGTRPTPPEVNLGKLVGLPFSTVQTALGPADAPLEFEYDWDCGADTCQIYTFGADERRSLQSQMAMNGKDLESMVVTTGGPYLLVLGVSSNTVVTARWQGQR